MTHILFPPSEGEHVYRLNVTYISSPPQDLLTDLKLVIEDTRANVATLQDCGTHQRGHTPQIMGIDRFEWTDGILNQHSEPA